MFFIIKKLCNFLALMLLFFPNLSLALSSDSKQVIHIEADNASLDQKNKITIFNGGINGVIITQGSLKIYADQAKATENNNRDKLIILSGKPVHFTQLQDDGKLVVGQGNNLSYNSKTDMIILSGRARIKKEGNLVMGETINYNIKSQVSSALSIKDGSGDGRITVILEPNQNDKKY